MGRLTLESSMVTDITSVSNLFIDKYMPRANGDFVKIYIHLLRLMNSLEKSMDLATIADTFNFTEGDVIRALKYWEGLGLLTLSKGENNVYKGIRLEPFGRDEHYIKGVHYMQMDSQNNIHINKDTPDIPNIPLKKQYTADEIQSFSTMTEIKQLLFIAQAYLAKPLSPIDVNSLLYMYDCLGLPTDFIEYIMETCISDGYQNLSSIEKVAIDLYMHDVKDVEQAKLYKKKRTSISRKILDAFGITGRLPGKDENSYIVKWQEEYGFGEELIIEACNRTISHTHSPSFKYANSILASWYKSGVRKMDDISKLDDEHAKENARKYTALKTAGVQKPKLKGGQKISEKEYNLNSLEKQLLK